MDRWYQETHETAAKTAARRARQLRAAGYTVSTGPLGLQVTPVGLVRLTLLTVHNDDGNIPNPTPDSKPASF